MKAADIGGIRVLAERLHEFEVQGLISDIDGVMTSGIVLLDAMNNCSRAFSLQDGLGQVAMKSIGVLTGFISSANCESGVQRLWSLGATFVETNLSSIGEGKGSRLLRLVEKYKLDPKKCVYLGDDIADLDVLGIAGLFLAPQNAALQVLKEADMVLDAAGGSGFYRQVCEAVHFSKKQCWIGG